MCVCVWGRRGDPSRRPRLERGRNAGKEEGVGDKGGNQRGESEKELVRDAEGLIIKGRSMK